ncbi:MULTISPECIES: hypothetical protein [unclassified Mesorhizobium]|uniref:hypothetical protein n=1 Tax=unclassified Mesorhizobium TaxID=325217 RepID=UPI00296213B7|nr:MULTISPECIES: hypothetical protein [unclassified Mesorhizobium]
MPAQSIYLTDGPSRRAIVGKSMIDLRHHHPASDPARERFRHRCSGPSSSRSDTSR